MIKEKARYRTKLRIENAMLHLLEQKSFYDITIDDIVEEAMLTKTTFYRYFKDKHDVVTCYYHELMQDIWSNIDSYEKLKDSMFRKYRKMEENKLFFRQAYQVEDANSLFAEERRSIRTTLLCLYQEATGLEPDEEAVFLIQFYCIGTMKMISSWVRDGMDISSERLTILLLEAIPMVIKQKIYKEENKDKSI